MKMSGKLLGGAAKLFCYSQVREVRYGPHTDEQGYSALCAAMQKMVDDERGETVVHEGGTWMSAAVLCSRAPLCGADTARQMRTLPERAEHGASPSGSDRGA